MVGKINSENFVNIFKRMIFLDNEKGYLSFWFVFRSSVEGVEAGFGWFFY